MGSLARKILNWHPASGGRGCDLDEVKVGATFARHSAHFVTETAKVLAVEMMEDGILHVRYNCKIHRANDVYENGMRTLSLPSFVERFGVA